MRPSFKDLAKCYSLLLALVCSGISCRDGHWVCDAQPEACQKSAAMGKLYLGESTELTIRWSYTDEDLNANRRGGLRKGERFDATWTSSSQSLGWSQIAPIVSNDGHDYQLTLPVDPELTKTWQEEQGRLMVIQPNTGTDADKLPTLETTSSSRREQLKWKLAVSTDLTGIDKSGPSGCDTKPTTKQPATVQIGIVDKVLWALVPANPNAMSPCYTQFLSCSFLSTDLQWNVCKINPSTKFPQDSLDGGHSLADFATSSDRPVFYLQGTYQKSGSFNLAGLCPTDKLLEGTVSTCTNLLGKLPTELLAQSVAVHPQGSSAVLITTKGDVQRAELMPGFALKTVFSQGMSTQSAVALAPLVKGSEAESRYPQFVHRELIVATEGKNLTGAIPNGSGVLQRDQDFSKALQDGLRAVAGTTLTITAVALGDMNGDGQMDLAVAVGSTIHIALGRGFSNIPILTWPKDPTLGRKLDLPSSAMISALAIGDLNGDGKMDLAAASRATGRLYALIQD